MCLRFNIYFELYFFIYFYKVVGKKIMSIKIMGVVMRVDRCICVDFLECFILLLVIIYGFVNGSGLLEGVCYEFSCESGYLFIGDS